MHRFFHFSLLIFVVLVVVCCGQNGSSNVSKEADVDSLALRDSGMVYGLACEGCSDSVVWLLPPDLSDPIEYDIVNAMRKHKIFGKISTGDGIMVAVNPVDSAVADVVIDIDDLKGTWCYKVWPSLKRADDLPPGAQEMIMSEIPDSILKIYYRPVEYGIILKRNHVASPVSSLMGSVNVNEDDPFIYTPEDMYVAWRFVDGHIVLTRQVEQHIIVERDSLEEVADENIPVHIESTMVHDTVDIVLLMEDSLALQFKDRVQGYYRKK